jgi:hypothetical protein
MQTSIQILTPLELGFVHVHTMVVISLIPWQISRKVKGELGNSLSQSPFKILDGK